MGEVDKFYSRGVPFGEVYASGRLVWADLNPFEVFTAGVASDGGTLDSLFATEYEKIPSNIKESATLIIVPGAYKTEVLYGINPKTGAIVNTTFQRASSGSYSDKDGVFQFATANIPRIDYNANTKAYQGLLFEKSATNYLLKSKLHNTVTWIKTSNNAGFISPGVAASITTNYTVAPNNVQEANRIRLNKNTTGRSGIYQGLTGLVAGRYYTCTTYIRIFGAAIEDTLLSNIGAVFSGQTAGPDTSRRVEKVNNDFYKLISTDLVGAAGPTYRIQLIPESFLNTIDCAIWECGVEEGLVSTSMIHTESSPVTRPADTLSIPIAVQSNVIVESESGTTTTLVGPGTYNPIDPAKTIQHIKSISVIPV